MHILHVTPYYAPAYAFGGVTRAVEGLARALVAAGHQVTVLTTDAGTQTSRVDAPLTETRDGVGVIRIPNRSVGVRGRVNLSTPFDMGRAARKLLPDVDVVHCHEFRTVENLLVTPIAAGMNKPLVLSPHGTLTLATGRSALKSTWDRLLSPAMAKRFSAVVGLTAAEVADAQAAWDRLGIAQPPTFAKIPNGVEPEVFTALPDSHPFRARYGLGNATVCLFLGRLHPRKGVEVLARAFLVANAPDSRLVIAGPDEGALNSLRPLLNDRIIVTGYLQNRERLEALASADLFALPAVGEGLSMAALEAMASGIPVILSPGCNLPEADEADAGLIVEPEVEPLAAALWLMLTDHHRRREMGSHAQTLVRERFTWETVAQEYQSLYNRMIH